MLGFVEDGYAELMAAADTDTVAVAVDTKVLAGNAVDGLVAKGELEGAAGVETGGVISIVLLLVEVLLVLLVEEVLLVEVVLVLLVLV